MPTLFRPTAICVCVFALIAAHADAQVLPAEDHSVELALDFWTPTPEATLGTDALADTNIDQVDFIGEFGIEKKTFPLFRAVVGRGHKFRVSHVNSTYDADTTLQRTFVFQGRTFTIGGPAIADMKWDLWTFGYEWDFVSGRNGFAGLFVDVKYNRVDASIDSPVLREAATTDVKAVVPTVGGIGRVYLGPMVAITGELTGLRFTREDFEGKFFDFDINGIVSFGRYVGAQVGYRSVFVDYLVDEDSGELRMKGPYFGGLVRF